MEEQIEALRLKIFHESAYVYDAAPLWCVWSVNQLRPEQFSRGGSIRSIQPNINQSWSSYAAETDWKFFLSKENLDVVPYTHRLFKQIMAIILDNHVAAILSPSPYIRTLAQLIKRDDISNVGR